LLVKTLAKPVSKRIKHEFNRTATTRNILHSIGQASHQATSRFTIWSAGYKVKKVTPLEKEEAMKIGSEFVGESFILIVSAWTVLFEYNRSKIKEEKKAAQKREEEAEARRVLQEQLHAINVRLLALESAAVMEHHHRHPHTHNPQSRSNHGTSTSIWNGFLMSGIGARKPSPPLETTPSVSLAPSNAASESSNCVSARPDATPLQSGSASDNPTRPIESQTDSGTSPSSPHTLTSEAMPRAGTPSTPVPSKSPPGWWNLWGLW
jgi:optic atrophy 3 protein